MLRDAGNRGVITSVEARTAIALFLRREAKYQEAIEVVRSPKNEYPHDFLFCLEEANLRKDDGEGMAAVDAYRELLAEAAKPGYFASSSWNWPISASATPCAASATTMRRRRRTSRPPRRPAWGPNSRFARCWMPANAAI